MPEKTKDWATMIDIRRNNDCALRSYFGINLEIVWETMCNDLPVLEASIHTMIEADSGSWRRKSGLRRTIISILELGQQQPSLTTILKLAKALNQPPHQIIRMLEKELAKSEGEV